MQFSSLSCYFHSCRSRYFPQHAVLTLIPSPSINLRDQVLHTYKTTGKIIFSRLSEPLQLVKNDLNHADSRFICWLEAGGSSNVQYKPFNL
jgi:hypothetical protein